MRVRHHATVDLSSFNSFFLTNEKAEREVGHRFLLDKIYLRRRSNCLCVYIPGRSACTASSDEQFKSRGLHPQTLCASSILAREGIHSNEYTLLGARGGAGPLACTSTISLAISIGKSNLGDT